MDAASVMPELALGPGVRLLAVGPAAVRDAWAGDIPALVEGVDEAIGALSPRDGAVVLVASEALGDDPVATVERLLEARPEAAVLVVDDGARSDAAALLGAGAQDVLQPGEVTGPNARTRLAAALVRRGLLRAAERRARRHELLNANASEGYAVLDAEGRILGGSPSGSDRDRVGDLSGNRFLEYVLPHDKQRLRTLFDAVASQPGATAETEAELLIDGRRKWVEATLSNLSNEESLGGIVVNYWEITARKEAERAVARNAALLDAVGQAVIATDREGTVRYWNPAAAELYGWSAEEAIGRRARDLIGTAGPEQLEEIYAKLGHGLPWSGELVLQRRNGKRFPAWVTNTPFYDNSGVVAGVVGVSSDITERREAEVRFQTAFEQSPIGLVVSDLEGRPTSVNPAICRMLGRSPQELVGRRWVEFGAPGDRPLGVAVLTGLDDATDTYSEERRYLRPDGSDVWLEVHVTKVRDALGAPLYYMAQMQDVTARKEAQAQLIHQALHDELTGLPNRAVLNQQLDAALAVGAMTGRRVGVAFIDLDGFKHVNDALGHVVGDKLLVQVGDRLASNIRLGDTVVRFGGDEYVLVCQDVTEETMVVLTEAVTAVMTAPYLAEGRVVDLHASVGITVSRADSTTDSLLSEADAAMYRAKELGRDRAVVFDDSLRDRSADLLESEQALRAALANDELSVHYQPIVTLTDGRPVGVEALVRWHSADGKVFMPGEFIPVAERSGLIVRLGAWVLERAATEVAGWNAAEPGRPPMWVAVNLSARQLGDQDLPSLVADVLQRSGLPPALLHLEITETVVMQDVNESIAVLNALKDIGVKLSIDDFGTGYSSLAYLRQLPVNVLKIDRSFVRDLGSDSGGASIVEAVLSLGKALGMTCLAEGVETPDQHAALKALSCPLGQGYLWSRPIPGADALRWLRSQPPLTP
ncbi:EAL domain-containing protein [Acidiferrimicrobium sp. IK]|uniref:sensor domain-containing protein n=1 Tax=Acidiferrimicrobium sp. IK TaxID=2871700 RepID=UPI0021CB59AF|nr:EAL domain-containing protein [Acidiferrimicrobium sp. IK]MCU4187041.1 EAL domain-containing protein [Acidiferrimicrobium sp. IK]